MEVFMTNVPQDLSDDALAQELRPYMNALGIVDWTCDKPRRKTQAWVKFLEVSEGQKFLDRHGKIKGKPHHGNENAHPSGLLEPRFKVRDIARLHILATPIFAMKSNRAVDNHTISHLKHKREKQTQASRQHDPQEPVPLFQPAQRTEIPILFGSSAVFTQKLVSITIYTAPGSLVSCTRLEFYNHTIQDFIADTRNSCVTLILTEPPRMYEPVILSKGPAKWERVPHSRVWDSLALHMSTNLVYRITLSDRDNLAKLVKYLKRREILEVTLDHVPVKGDSDDPDYQHVLDVKIKRLCSLSYLPFALLFQVEALVSNNYLQPIGAYQLLEIMERVSIDSMEKEVAFPVTTDAMKQLLQMIPYPCPGTDPAELDTVELMRKVMDAEYDARDDNPQRDRIYGIKIPSHQVWVFKAMVTPTRILLTGPEAESRNRVLRMFPNHNDYFLRVTFCDEDGQDLAFNPKVSNERIFLRYKKVLDRGLYVAGRKFSFLGFSHSSLRSHSVWFVAPFDSDHNAQPQNYNTILSSLGDFKNIRVPAKCAARIGQAFSETPYAVPLAECGIKILQIPDVKSADESRVFSDGVGTISWEALEEIWPHLPIQSGLPTCLQIRLGGYKGMLSLDSRLDGKVICLRKESMMKFPSNDLTELGICDTSSKPLRLFLNRQMIKILEDMGTEDQWFLDMQKKALDVFRAVTANAANTSAFLKRQSSGINMGFPKLVTQLDKMGIDYRRDIFMKSAVDHMVLRELRLLKHKARIPIEQGVTLFGIMDETGFLKENEVYVTYDRTWNSNKQRIDESLKDGRVVVTRSPALHPGDVRVALMATPPNGHPLRDLQNCIVFSQKGSRDLPSQLSGGDLDGDLYNIIWDQNASPESMFAPADYPRITPASLNRDVTRNDITNFFIDFMKTDLLGVIATRHVILADARDDGTLDLDCVTLANMHSTAVDFSKTGIPVSASKLPKPPRFRPDFLATAPPLELYDFGHIEFIDDEEDDDDGAIMASANHKYYLSEKILGRLFRNVDEKKIWKEDIQRNIPTGGPSVWDQLLGLVESRLGNYDLDINWERKSQEAWKIRNLYDTSISNLMFDYSENPRSPLTEVEVFCGFILNKRGGQTRRQRDSSIKLKEEIDRVMTWIVKVIRDRGMGNDDTASNLSVAQGRESVIELCWACLAIGCIKDVGASPLYHGTGELQSFRVVAACCLVKELNALVLNMNASTAGGAPSPAARTASKSGNTRLGKRNLREGGSC
ncbi:hypothetical protein AK830_g10255 [Neonectria ditissima]|uniref:RNA-dependent RNA polymerase n=1 Tax=Neonectria ditissima TaxID=78410 RepID=A0A0P7BAU0_9HYPO|nr:hypothetical protein AK830_g10255 [Neonectria ditissima]